MDFNFDPSVLQNLSTNPMFLAGVGILGDRGNNVGGNIARGFQTANEQQLAPVTLALKRLELQRAQRAANFNPADYMQTDQSDYNGLLNGSSQAQQGQAISPGAAAPAALGGPMGQIPQISTQTPTQGQVNFAPGQPTGTPQLDLPALVSGGIKAGLPAQDIQAIGMAMDPERYARMQAAAKALEPYTLAPGAIRGNPLVGVAPTANTNAPPESKLGQINALTAARDKAAAAGDTATAAQLDAAINQVSGKASQDFRAQALKFTQERTEGDPEANLAAAKAIASYQQAPLSAYSLKTPVGASIMKQVMQLNPQYNAQNYASSQKAYNAFSSGTQSNTVRSMNVGIEHLQTLMPLIDALQNGNVQAVNQISNAYKAQFGGTAPTNFEAAKAIVSDEVVKAIVGSQNALGDRDELKRQLANAKTPEQLKGVVSTWVNLMGGQLKGLKQQYTSGTMRNDFDEKWLTPNARAALEGTAPRIPVRSGMFNGKKVIQYSDGTTEYVK